MDQEKKNYKFYIKNDNGEYVEIKGVEQVFTKDLLDADVYFDRLYKAQLSRGLEAKA